MNYDAISYKLSLSKLNNVLLYYSNFMYWMFCEAILILLFY